MTTVSAERLSKIFVEVADTLVDEFDLLEFLHMLTVRAQALVDASAVGLLLADQRGELQFMAASHESARLLELFQLQNNEGPCLEAYRTGEPVIVGNLRETAGRWPRFEAAAMEAGICSVHAFPLRLRREVIGAMNIFGQETVLALDEADEQIVQALADVAAIALLQERTIHRGEILTEQLQSALNSRIVIEQAKGALAQALNVDVDEAFTLLRSYARRGGRRLGDVAQMVVTDLSSIPDLTPPHSS